MLDLLKCVSILVLASSFVYGQPTPAIITEQPPALVDAVARQNIKFSVVATGSDLRYFWHRDSTFLSAGTNATLSLNNITTNQAGTYYVIVSNSVNSVRSSNVLVRVIPDTFGPRIISAALLAEDSSRVYVSFDEDLLFRGPAGATNLDKFVITDLATGERVPVTAALPGIGILAVRLTLSVNLDRGKTYEICISNVADTLTNYIALNSCVPIAFETITNIFDLTSIWSFYCGAGSPPPDWNTFAPMPLPPWCDGYAVYDFFDPCIYPSRPPFGSSPYYFRKVFAVSTNLLGMPVTAVFTLPQITDPAIFYLNGAEILRKPIVINESGCWTTSIAVGHLLSATNLLAIEILGEFFDVSLSLKYMHAPHRPPAGDVFLRYSNYSPTELRLYWTNGMGYALEYVNALGDQWRELQPPSTNLVVNKTGPVRFYRLNKRH